jgi:hypothetical protein
MDNVSGKPAGKPVDISDRIRAAALDSGVLPKDPLGPLVEAIGDVPDEIEARIAPFLAQVKTFTITAQQAADRPLMSTHQVKYDLLPAIVAAISWGKSLVGAVVILASIGIGWGAHWLATQLQCDLVYNGRSICYRDNGPGPPQPAPPATTPRGRQ